VILTVTLNAAIDRTVAVPNFRLGRRHRAVESRTVAGGKGVRVTGRNQATGMIVSAVLKDAHPGWTAVEHREDAWTTLQTESPMGREDVKRSERGPMALLEMRVPTFWGRAVNQQNVSAYLVRDGVWADVHLSKVNFKEEDRALFEKVLASVRIEE